jgi:geranylgeranyl diphosphate synthase type II
MKTDSSADRSFELAHWIRSRQHQVETILAARLPARTPADDPGRLVESMRYSLLAPGKRLRPLVALAAAEALAGHRRPEAAAASQAPDGAVLLAAASVELVHCYSLIHDDLPAMDDDDFRRGKPSNHKAFGEFTAILAGDALLTLAFEWLAEAGAEAERAQDFVRAVAALARGAGVNGMVRGQARDLGEPPPAGLPEVERLHDEKTAALFRAAAEVGTAAAGGTPPEIAVMGTFGQRFGVAFQHADDRDDGDHPEQARRIHERVPALLAEGEQALDGLLGPAGGRILRALGRDLLRRVVGTPSESQAGGR